LKRQLQSEEHEEEKQTEVSCTNNHPMARISGRVGSYEGNPFCDVCRTGELNLEEFFYHCEECRYDVCMFCGVLADESDQ
jgi:hypothetical protein